MKSVSFIWTVIDQIMKHFVDNKIVVKNALNFLFT